MEGRPRSRAGWAQDLDTKPQLQRVTRGCHLGLVDPRDPMPLPFSQVLRPGPRPRVPQARRPRSSHLAHASEAAGATLMSGESVTSGAGRLSPVMGRSTSQPTHGRARRERNRHGLFIRMREGGLFHKQRCFSESVSRARQQLKILFLRRSESYNFANKNNR